MAKSAADAVPDPSSTREPKDHIAVFSKKGASKYVDPCSHAAQASMKCLEKNSYNREKCSQVFED